jgi:hypothetical protein
VLSDVDVSPEAYWTKVGREQRKHPYDMHRTVNLDYIEVIHSVSDEENHPKRWVIVNDGTIEVWVRVADLDDYGYELQPDERVSAAELEAINLKHAAMRDGTHVPVEEALAFVESATSEQLHHALIALYYAAKADPTVPADDVDTLRETVHEHTSHVDTSHTPTLLAILGDAIDDEKGNTTT